MCGAKWKGNSFDYLDILLPLPLLVVSSVGVVLTLTAGTDEADSIFGVHLFVWYLLTHRAGYSDGPLLYTKYIYTYIYIRRYPPNENENKKRTQKVGADTRNATIDVEVDIYIYYIAK